MAKRFFDIFIVVIIMPLVFPTCIIISLLVWWDLGNPILFKQKRVGKDETFFEIIKFRTMRGREHENGKQVPDSERLSRIGKILRAFSLDELPELINVIQGNMSLVGPRPLLIEYLPLYSSVQKRRHEVSPGITGWAQVNGRNSISWEKKLTYDVWYVDNHSFYLDLKIIFFTIKKVLVREGISADGEVTIQKFKGSED